MINDCQSKAAICKMLGCRPSTLESTLQRWGILYKGNQGLRGLKTDSKRKSALEYAKSQSYISSNRLKRKLIEDGVRKAECEDCGRTEWMSKLIPLELHHKDGNHYNNDIGNLAILCPNCHSLTPNHSKKYSAR